MRAIVEAPWGLNIHPCVYRGGDKAFEMAERRIREGSSSWRRGGEHVSGAMSGGVSEGGWGVRERLVFDVLGMQ
jgi:hypothetical protein